MESKTNWQKDLFNRPELWGKVIVISEDKIIYWGNSYQDVIRKQGNRRDYSMFKVPTNLDQFRLLSFKLKSLRKHYWLPTYPVTFFPNEDLTQKSEMLVDSGADISVVNNEFGRLLGFEKTPHEVKLEAEGIGGSVSYLLRTADIDINGHTFECRFAWLEDTRIPDMIIGRENVFDLFDIEFKQADEQIIFTKRNPV